MGRILNLECCSAATMICLRFAALWNYHTALLTLLAKVTKQKSNNHGLRISFVIVPSPTLFQLFHLFLFFTDSVEISQRPLLEPLLPLCMVGLQLFCVALRQEGTS